MLIELRHAFSLLSLFHLFVGGCCNTHGPIDILSALCTAIVWTTGRTQGQCGDIDLSMRPTVQRYKENKQVDDVTRSKKVFEIVYAGSV